MEVTRRFWEVAALGGVLVAVGLLADRTLPLYGAAVVWGVLVARAALFVVEAKAAPAETDVHLDATPGVVATDEPTAITLSGTPPSTLLASVTASPPVSARDAGDLALSLDGDGRETATATVEFPVAGRFRFEPAKLHLRDAAGLFAETVPTGDPPSVHVQARRPRNVHVGEAGERLAGSFGEHAAGQGDSGLEPVELREYVAGDTLSNIDWKATARLATPHVREYETQTDYRTTLLLDARSRLDEGPDGETALDYLREVALSIAAVADENRDPLGLFVVDDGGIVDSLPASTTAEQYDRVRRRLEEVSAGSGGQGRSPQTADPSDARGRSLALSNDESAFARRVRPYLEDVRSHVERIEGDSLFDATRSVTAREGGGGWTVILTDDSDRSTVLESAKTARRGDSTVLVALAPRVLFEPGSFADLERAHDRYVEFESFRRRLANVDGVRAVEVAPGERIQTLLSNGSATSRR